MSNEVLNGNDMSNEALIGNDMSDEVLNGNDMSDEVLIGNIRGYITTHSDGWYLNCIGSSNDAFFTIPPYAFVKDLLGYSPGDGVFPEVKTREDLLIVVKELQNLHSEQRQSLPFSGELNQKLYKQRDETGDICLINNRGYAVHAHKCVLLCFEYFRGVVDWRANLPSLQDGGVIELDFIDSNQQLDDLVKYLYNIQYPKKEADAEFSAILDRLLIPYGNRSIPREFWNNIYWIQKLNSPISSEELNYVIQHKPELYSMLGKHAKMLSVLNFKTIISNLPDKEALQFIRNMS